MKKKEETYSGKVVYSRLKQYNFLFTYAMEKRIDSLAKLIYCTHIQGGKIILCGNGGSAAQSLHFAAELNGKFRKRRSPIAAISLNSDVATITAIANDYKYDSVFARQLEALGNSKDLFIVLSTSGESANIINALKTAQESKLNSFALLGKDGGIAQKYVNDCIIVTSEESAIVQEVHLLVIHIVCEIIDGFFPNE